MRGFIRQLNIGSVSPMLSNIFLHYVLDEWFAKVVQPRMRGRSYMIRFCDDFIIGCEYKYDAERIMEVLPKRMNKYNLTLHPSKTKLLDFRKPERNVKREIVTFLGFTVTSHFLGGNPTLGKTPSVTS